MSVLAAISTPRRLCLPGAAFVLFVASAHCSLDGLSGDAIAPDGAVHDGMNGVADAGTSTTDAGAIAPSDANFRDQLQNDAGFDCSVHADAKLYCTNLVGAAMYATPSLSGAVVNHLRMSYSYFECWGTGDLHAGGNTTWYRTLGDDTPDRGWLPAVDLNTPATFDANPSAYGFAKCP
jgi:hypothetical protein